MPTPEWRKKLPKAQSFKEQFIDDINQQEKNLVLGPLGTSSSAVHPTGEGTPPAGKPPRTMFGLDWLGNVRAKRREA